MLLSWGFLLPAGVIAAHFLRHRKPLWFKIHRAVQMTGLVLATIGWVIALTQFEVFGQGVNVSSLHGGLGMIVMVLGLLQPINAFFRPHPEPKTRKRDIWGAYTFWCLNSLLLYPTRVSCLVDCNCLRPRPQSRCFCGFIHYACCGKQPHALICASFMFAFAFLFSSCRACSQEEWLCGRVTRDRHCCHRYFVGSDSSETLSARIYCSTGHSRGWGVVGAKRCD